MLEAFGWSAGAWGIVAGAGYASGGYVYGPFPDKTSAGEWAARMVTTNRIPTPWMAVRIVWPFDAIAG